MRGQPFFYYEGLDRGAFLLTTGVVILADGRNFTSWAMILTLLWVLPSFVFQRDCLSFPDRMTFEPF
jgi:hypothetical protein